MFDLATSSREHSPRIRAFGLGVLALVMLAILGLNSVACVRTGHVGVVTVFGRVTEGMDVVDQIEGAETDARDKPVDEVRIESVALGE